MRTVLAPFGTCTLNSFLTWNDACFGCAGLATSLPNTLTVIAIAMLAAKTLKKRGLIRICRESMVSFLVQTGCTDDGSDSCCKRNCAPTERRRGIYRQVKPRLKRINMHVLADEENVIAQGRRHRQASSSELAASRLASGSR